VKKGAPIICSPCGAVVFLYVGEDDPAPLKCIVAADFTKPDGAPLEPGILLTCPVCGARFLSIDSKTGKTLPKARL
jgi:hypothetical protein